MSCLMMMMMVCDAGWVSKRGQLLFCVRFVREKRVKRYYGIWNKVTKYWEEIDLCVCVCVCVCVSYVYTKKTEERRSKKSDACLFVLKERRCLFFFACLIFASYQGIAIL